MCTWVGQQDGAGGAAAAGRTGQGQVRGGKWPQGHVEVRLAVEGLRRGALQPASLPCLSASPNSLVSAIQTSMAVSDVPPLLMG